MNKIILLTKNISLRKHQMTKHLWNISVILYVFSVFCQHINTKVVHILVDTRKEPSQLHCGMTPNVVCLLI